MAFSYFNFHAACQPRVVRDFSWKFCEFLTLHLLLSVERKIEIHRKIL